MRLNHERKKKNLIRVHCNEKSQKRKKVTEMWKNLVERRAVSSNGGRRLSEAAMSRSFQAMGE